jgi:hypothetical protein
MCEPFETCLYRGYGQRPDLRFVFYHDMLSHPICPAMDLSSIGILWPGSAYATNPLPCQGCLVDTHGRHDYRGYPDPFLLQSPLMTGL